MTRRFLDRTVARQQSGRLERVGNRLDTLFLEVIMPVFAK